MRGRADVGVQCRRVSNAQLAEEEDTVRSHVRARTVARTRQPVHTYARVAEVSASKIGHLPKPAIIDRDAKSYLYMRDSDSDIDIDANDLAGSRFTPLFG